MTKILIHLFVDFFTLAYLIKFCFIESAQTKFELNIYSLLSKKLTHV